MSINLDKQYKLGSHIKLVELRKNTKLIIKTIELILINKIIKATRLYS